MNGRMDGWADGPKLLFLTDDWSLPTWMGENRNDLVVLSPGLSGSSVLTGLLTRAGYWTGSETEKVGWETYENSRLVELNRRILSEAGFGWHDVGDLPPPSEEDIREVSLRTELSAFLRRCEEHRPWIWKDPRLCYTIHLWSRHLDLQRCSFLVMTREPWRTWTGIINGNRSRLSERQFTAVYDACLASVESFLEKEDVTFIRMSFEELVERPRDSIERLNRYVEPDLDVADLREVYRGNLGESRHSRGGYLLARIRYLIALFLGRVQRLPRSSEG